MKIVKQARNKDKGQLCDNCNRTAEHLITVGFVVNNFCNIHLSQFKKGVANLKDKLS